MSILSGSSTTAVAQAGAYTSALLDLLGGRDPLDVLRSTPATISVVVSGLTSASSRASGTPCRHDSPCLVAPSCGHAIRRTGRPRPLPALRIHPVRHARWPAAVSLAMGRVPASAGGGMGYADRAYRRHLP